MLVRIMDSESVRCKKKIGCWISQHNKRFIPMNHPTSKIRNFLENVHKFNAFGEF